MGKMLYLKPRIFWVFLCVEGRNYDEDISGYYLYQ